MPRYVAPAPYVVLEAHGSPTWLPVGFPLTQDDAPASVTSDEPDGRQVYLFGWIAGAAGVWRSAAGIDVADSAVRVIASLDLRRLSTLDEPYELLIYRPAGLRLLRVRYVR